MTVQKNKKSESDEAAVRAKIAKWPQEFRPIGERLHAAITAADPDLKPKVWYGMPSYAKQGPVLVFFRIDDGIVSVGLTENANFSIDEDAPDKLMASAWFLTELDEATEKRITEIVRQATA